MMKKKFKAQDGELFEVTEVIETDKQLWVHYNKIKTGEKYSCLLEAFSERFVPLEE